MKNSSKVLIVVLAAAVLIETLLLGWLYYKLTLVSNLQQKPPVSERTSEEGILKTTDGIVIPSNWTTYTSDKKLFTDGITFQYPSDYSISSLPAGSITIEKSVGSVGSLEIRKADYLGWSPRAAFEKVEKPSSSNIISQEETTIGGRQAYKVTWDVNAEYSRKNQNMTSGGGITTIILREEILITYNDTFLVIGYDEDATKDKSTREAAYGNFQKIISTIKFTSEPKPIVYLDENNSIVYVDKDGSEQIIAKSDPENNLKYRAGVILPDGIKIVLGLKQNNTPKLEMYNINTKETVPLSENSPEFQSLRTDPNLGSAVGCLLEMNTCKEGPVLYEMTHNIY